MPTGYTANLYHGEQSFEDFVMGCARGMGALITMRDAPKDAPIPEEFTVDPFYVDSLARAEQEYDEAKALTPERAATLAAVDHERALSHYQRETRLYAERKARLEAMREKVAEWVPPTDEHVKFRSFMLDMLDRDIADCDPKWMREPVMLSGDEFRTRLIEKAERSLRSATESLERERANAESRTRWIRALRESLNATSGA